MKLKFLYIIAVMLFVFGCKKKNVDLIPPTMEVNSYLPPSVEAEICGSQEPVVFILTGGDEFTFDVIFKDDVALSQYKIDIHNNFDCHGHGGGSAPSVSLPNIENQTEDWSVLDIQNISGNSSSIIKTLTVPENVTAGNYHFHIQVIDESGNDIPFANFHSMTIKNPIDEVAPSISVQEPINNSFSAAKGETIQFKGQVTDDRSLSDGGNGVLYLAYTDLSSGNTFTTNKVFPFDEDVETEFIFDFEYTIPQTLVTGDYRFTLGAYDGVNNVAPFIFFNIELTN